MSMLFKRIKDWATSITAFRSGDVIAVDGPDGTAKMSKDDLLKETAENAVNSGVAIGSRPSIDDFSIVDENNNAVAIFDKGNLKTKNFDSSVAPKTSGGMYDFSIDDVYGNSILRFNDGHLQTKNFNSLYVTKPRPVILDTDWWTDVDDAVAIRLLIWAELNGMVDIVGVCVNAIRNNSALTLSRYLNYEGRDLCIGMDKQATDYDRVPSYFQTIENNWAYGRYSSNDQCEDCVDFYVRALNKVKGKVDIIAVGYLNALSRLLNSYPQLVREKVDTLYVMGGKYPSGSENNFNRTARSRAAAVNICSNWPTPIIFSGFEIGSQVITGGTLQNTTGTDDLLYKCLNAAGFSNGRESWDPMTTLLACIGDTKKAGYSLVRGTNVVDPYTGANTFTANNTGNHYYVTMRYPATWYKWAINSVIEKIAWPYRKVGIQSLPIV